MRSTSPLLQLRHNPAYPSGKSAGFCLTASFPVISRDATGWLGSAR